MPSLKSSLPFTHYSLINMWSVGKVALVINEEVSVVHDLVYI